MNHSKHPDLKAFRGSILHFLSDPGTKTNTDAYEYFEDGVLFIENGRVVRIGPADQELRHISEDLVTDYSGNLIVPGLIDAHIHYPQTDMIAAYGEQLIEWLNKYTFPTELKFSDQAYAEEVAEFFLDELLRNGTTSALVLPTVHPGSTDAIFSAAKNRNMRLIAGKVMMDRNAPENLCDTPESSYRESKELLNKWHNQDRLLYAITPRFAPTCSDEQLLQAARLAKEYPDAYIHSHVAENKREVEWVAQLFPNTRSYLDVYDSFGLLRERAVYAHCIHLDAQDCERMAETGASAAFCPTSNTFLGSGLFNCIQAMDNNINVAVATDVGAGTSFSMWQTLSEAYKVTQLNGASLTPLRALYMATLGNAKALYIDDKIGNFSTGKEADFIVLNSNATELIKRRLSYVEAGNIAEKIFVYMILGDDRIVSSAYIMGELAHKRKS